MPANGNDGKSGIGVRLELRSPSDWPAECFLGAVGIASLSRGGGWTRAPPLFLRSVNPISTRGTHYSHPILCAPPPAFQSLKRPSITIFRAIFVDSGKLFCQDRSIGVRNFVYPRLPLVIKHQVEKKLVVAISMLKNSKIK